VTYPNDGNANDWKKLFKLCASQRLFLPELLRDVDSILYLDTDVLFLSPVEELWHLFTRYNHCVDSCGSYLLYVCFPENKISRKYDQVCYLRIIVI